MAKQIIGDVRVYTRHSETCDRKEDPSYLKCDCPKWMQWRENGKTLRGSANTRSFAGVKLAAQQKTKELNGGAIAPIAAVGTLAETITDWLVFRAKSGVGNVKAKMLGDKLLAWARGNGITSLQQITTARAMQFRDSLPYQTATSSSLKVHWAVVCNLFVWAHGMQYIATNPVPDLKIFPQFKIRFKKAEVVPPTAEEIDKVFAAIDNTNWTADRKYQVRSLFETMRASGMAVRDAVTLGRDKIADRRVKGERWLDDDNRIRGNRCKTNQRFKVRIPSWLAERLRALPCTDARYFFWHLDRDGNPMSSSAVVHRYDNSLRELLELAQVKMTSHGFRHFFITQQLAKGWSVDDVSTMVGTSPQEIRKTYHHWIKEGDDRMDAVQSEQWQEQGLDAEGNKPMVQ